MKALGGLAIRNSKIFRVFIVLCPIVILVAGGTAYENASWPVIRILCYYTGDIFGPNVYIATTWQGCEQARDKALNTKVFGREYRGMYLYNAAGYGEPEFQTASTHFATHVDVLMWGWWKGVFSALAYIALASIFGALVLFATLRALDWVLLG